MTNKERFLSGEHFFVNDIETPFFFRETPDDLYVGKIIDVETNLEIGNVTGVYSLAYTTKCLDQHLPYLKKSFTNYCFSELKFLNQ